MKKRKNPVAERLELAEGLHSAAIHLLRRLRRVDETAGLTAPKLSALSVLVFGGPCTIGRLAAAEQVRPPSMTKLVQDLERQGLVTREVAQEDRRSSLIKPTPKASAILKQGRSRRVTQLASWMTGLRTEDVESLRKSVEILNRLLEALV